MEALTLHQIDAILAVQERHSRKRAALPRNYYITSDGEVVGKRISGELSGHYSTPRRMSATKKARWKGGKAIDNPQYRSGDSNIIAVRATVV